MRKMRYAMSKAVTPRPSLPIDLDHPMIVDGWTLLPDDQQIPGRMTGMWTYDPDSLEAHLEPEQIKDPCYLFGTTIEERSANTGVGRVAMINAWVTNPDLYPEDWKDGRWYICWGDKYLGRDKGIYVRSARWHGGRVYAHWHYVIRLFDAKNPSLRATQRPVSPILSP